MMPAYNEESTLERIVERVIARPEVGELIIVDDGSEDATWAIAQRASRHDRRVKAIRQDVNRGKGAALKVAIEHLTAPFALVQDADLEYSPDDYPRLLEPLVCGYADVVYGVRGFAGHTAYSYWFVQGNRGLTWACNVLYNCYISDLLTGYKALRTDLWRRLNLQEDTFAVDPEITARVLRLGYRIHEVPIRYVTRTRAEGKKVRVGDAFPALGVLLRIRLASRARLFRPICDDGYHQERHRELAAQRFA
jgi:glycosyltransferase involved in cell wall biosynthesis